MKLENLFPIAEFLASVLTSVSSIERQREYGYPTNIYTYEGESQEDNAVFDDVVTVK